MVGDSGTGQEIIMRDPNRIPIVLDYIRRLWEKHPDWRLGQLLCNLRDIPTEKEGACDLWGIEDDDLVLVAKILLGENPHVKGK